MKAIKRNFFYYSWLIVMGLLVWSPCMQAMGSYNSGRHNNIQVAGATFGLTALVGGIYAHVVLPWYKQEKEHKQEEQHSRKQNEWRFIYTGIEKKYSNGLVWKDTIPALQAQKESVEYDATMLSQAHDFEWDDFAERQTIAHIQQGLTHYIEQLNRLIAEKTCQGICAGYQEEFVILKDKESIDQALLSKIIYEKFGSEPYRFTAYKKNLSKDLASCRSLNAVPEKIQALETLDKVTNYFFSSTLDQERVAQTAAERDYAAFQATLGAKQTKTEYFKDAKRYVEQASASVANVEKLCVEQRNEINYHSLALQTMADAIDSLQKSNGNQMERVVQEIRHNARETREATKQANAETERRLNNLEKKVTQAEALARGALASIPMPPATSPDAATPSAPMMPPPYPGR